MEKLTYQKGGAKLKKYLFLKIIAALVLLHLANSAGLCERVCSMPNGKKQVAITFDDGPCPPVTLEILRVLEKYGARATFFVTGENAEKFPEILREIVRRGNEIGNHTFNHKRLTAIGENQVHQQISRTQNAIYAITGIYPRYFRPPYSAIDQRREAIATLYWLTTAIWSVSPEDYKNPTAKIIAQKVLSDIKAGDIVVLHDGFCSEEPRPEGHPNTAEALPLILEGLRAKGLESVTLSNLCKK